MSGRDRIAKVGDDLPGSQDVRLLRLPDVVNNQRQPLRIADIGLWSSHFICKPPRVGRATPWHEDSAYWNGRASTMAGIYTVWPARGKDHAGNRYENA